MPLLYLPGLMVFDNVLMLCAGKASPLSLHQAFTEQGCACRSPRYYSRKGKDCLCTINGNEGQDDLSPTSSSLGSSHTDPPAPTTFLLSMLDFA